MFGAALRLGLTSFGGPVAHFGYFREEYVVRRRWLDDGAYGELVALCQLLPGPASSQLGIAIGQARAGYPGAFAAWAGFTLPSALALVAFAYGVDAFDLAGSGWLRGLQLVAVAVVAHAVFALARALTPDLPRLALAAAAAAVALLWRGVPGQLVPIAVGAAIGVVALRGARRQAGEPLRFGVSRRAGAIAAGAFVGLLAALPLLRGLLDVHAVAVADAFYRAGALVFGGGHVVLPLLHAEVVGPGWVGEDTFVAGYGAAQAVPGPLFTFAAYLGAAMGPDPTGAVGAALALGAVFLPSFLLLGAVLPFWERLRHATRVRAAVGGVNAAVVGLLAAALYDPVARTAIGSVADAAAAAALLTLLVLRVPAWAVAVAGAAAGVALAAVA